MGEEVLTEHRDRVAFITLNRPAQLNAFNEAQHILLAAALEKARDDDDIGAILITGAGRAFCAGQDLGERDPSAMDGPPDLGLTLDKYYNRLVRLIRAIPKPVITAVNGVAAGAGANIPLASDIVLAARSARFIQAFIKIGIIPDSGGTWTVTRAIGEARAKSIMMTGDPVSAEQAEAWGLIWRAVDDDGLIDEATALATRLAAGPTFGIGLIKQAVHQASENTIDQQLDLERDLQRLAGHSRDYREGVTAFLEKRPPKFTGRKG